MAVVAAAVPGADPVTTAFAMLPLLVVLYLASIVMLKISRASVQRREQPRSRLRRCPKASNLHLTMLFDLARARPQAHSAGPCIWLSPSSWAVVSSLFGVGAGNGAGRMLNAFSRQWIERRPGPGCQRTGESRALKATPAEPQQRRRLVPAGVGALDLGDRQQRRLRQQHGPVHRRGRERSSPR